MNDFDIKYPITSKICNKISDLVKLYRVGRIMCNKN